MDTSLEQKKRRNYLEGEPNRILGNRIGSVCLKAPDGFWARMSFPSGPGIDLASGAFARVLGPGLNMESGFPNFTP